MTLKVVQLTDTHLFATPDQTQKGINTYQSLEAVVADVAAHHPDFDALLLTGDLSQDETPESYDALCGLLAPIRGAPAYAIPGNHEDIAHMRSRLGRADIAVLQDAFLGPWRIIMANSRVPGQVHGEIGADQTRSLKSRVEETEDHVLIAVHHPPLPVDSVWLDALRCIDGESMLAEIAGPKVKAVVCGHVHQVFATAWRDTAILTTPSTCVQFKPGAKEFAIDDAPPGYRVFLLEDDGQWSTEVKRVGR